jgi:nucleoside-diphosphate kinase
MQTTFVMVKPDGVQRGLVGRIIGRFEEKGLRLVGLKQLTPSHELAASHYRFTLNGHSTPDYSNSSHLGL